MSPIKLSELRAFFRQLSCGRAKSRTMLYERLEDRVLFDAVPDASLDPELEDPSSQQQSNAERFDTSLYADDVKTVADTSLFSQDEPLLPAQLSRELVIVDTAVDGYQQLVDDLLGNEAIGREVNVVTIDGSLDGIAQISDALRQYSDLDALHIVSHGDSGSVNLGETALTRENLGGYAAEIAQWGNAFSADGDLLFLGCDLASSVEGRELLASISTLTGTDVAASVDDTGNTARGGDWDLEYVLGQMETSIAFSDEVQQNWSGLLAPGPDVNLTTWDQNAQVGEDVQFTVTFDNTAAAGSGDTGFGPFIDLLFPANGADGAAGTDVPDGLNFQNATYLGQTVAATQLTFVDVDGAYNDNGTPADTSDDYGTTTIGYVTHPYVQEVANELQLLSFGGDIDGGALEISVDGVSTSIDLSATSGLLDAAALQASLESLSSVGSGNVIVTGDMTDGFLVEFVGALAETNVAGITVDNSLLENGGSTDNPHGSFTSVTITHGDTEPQAKKIFGQPGDKLVVLELPFGSVTPEQPEVEVIVNASISELADLYEPGRPETELTVTARSGFRYGADAQDNSAVDPPLLSDIQDDPYSWVKSVSIRPSLLKVETDVLLGERETATGPDYPRTFHVRVDIPEGQTIEDLDITDLLPNNIVFLSLDNISSSDGSTVFTTNVPTGTNVLGGSTNNTGFTASNGLPPVDITGARDGQSLIVTADSITGGAGNDITIAFRAYVTEFEADSSGNPTSTPSIPVNGEDDLSGSVARHTGTAVGNWTATDPRDLGPTSVDNAVAKPHSSQVDAKSLAIQKSVRNIAPGNDFAAPGSVLEYTLNFQISDYFTFGDLVLTDTFSDGQQFYNAAGFEPVFTLSDFDNSYSSQQFNVHVGAETSATTELASDNFIVDRSMVDHTDDAIELGDGTYVGGASDPTDGTTTITIQLSERLQQLGEDGILQGGHTLDGDTELSASNLGAATGTIKFYTLVQQDYSDDFLSGDRSIDHDDRVSNVVSISGSVRENAEDGDIANVIGTEQDGSWAALEIEVGTLSKSIYAINGNTTLPGEFRLQPGDTITYRLNYSLPNSDFEDLTLTDYLPLPALVVGDFDGDDISGDAWTFDSDTVFDATPGVVELGPNDTFFHSDPGRSDFFDESNIEIDVAANSLRFNLGTYDDPANQSTEIDLLFTLTIQDDAFADGMYLTNIARAQFGATNHDSEPVDALVQIQLSQPALNIKKGVVATDDATVILEPVGPEINSEFQQISYTGGNTSATFQLTFGGQVTSDLSVTTSAASVQLALESLSSIGAGNVSVTGGRLHEGTFDIEFQGALAGTDVAELVAGTSDASGVVRVSVATVFEGADPIVINGVGEATPFTGRITSAALADQAIDLDITDPAQGLEAGDKVRFMIVVENTGEGRNGAFDVQLRDQLPAEFEYVAGSLSVVDGTGAAIGFTTVGTHPEHALFGSGIVLDDPGATPDAGDGTNSGSLDRYSAYSGQNVVIVTYDAQLVDEAAFENDNVERAETITNHAILVSYAGREGADDHTPSRNEVQTISATDAPIGGTYTLTFEGQTTGAIAFDADRNAVKAALAALSTVGTGNVRVAGTSLAEGPLEVRFIGELGDTNVTQIVVDETGLNRLAVTSKLDGNTNEIQTLKVDGNVGGGYFSLTLAGETTIELGFNTSALQVQSALGNLPGVGAGNVIVSGSNLPYGEMTIEFVGSLATQDIAEITVDAASLRGGGSFTTVTETQGSANEFQNLNAAGIITGGTFNLTFNGQTTASLSHSATPADIELALESLSTIGAGNVSVTGAALPGGSIVVQFQGALANSDVSSLQVDGSALTATDLLTVATTTQGSFNESQQLTTSGTLSNGDFTLTLDGETTAAIAYNADAATIQAALETLNVIPSGSVIVTGTLATGIDIRFTGGLTQQNVSQLVVDSGNLTGGTVAASTVQQGSLQDPTDNASIVIRDGSLTKSIVSTSESHTGVDGGVERVTIGEIVRYRISVELPGGSHTNVRVYDILPSGLAYIDDGTAVLSYVADNPGSIISTVGAGTLPDDAVSRNAGSNRDDYTNGLNVWFKLGDIVNTEADTNAEYAVIEFNALVMNNGGANFSNSKYNDAQLYVDGDRVSDLAQEDRPLVQIVEPLILTPRKQVKMGSGSYGESVTADAGDVVDFRIRFTGSNSIDRSDAFDVRLQDTMPEDISLDVSSIVVYVDDVLQVSGVTNDSAGNTIDLTLDRVNKGQKVEVRYAASLEIAVSPNETLTNTANVTWTSLPGDFGTGGNATGSDLASLNGLDTNASGTDDASGVTYASTSGAEHGERNGDSAGAQNDYSNSDTASVAVAGTKSITKNLVSTSIDDTSSTGNNLAKEAVIGETAIYEVTVNFNEGTMPNAKIVDVLDSGLAFTRMISGTSNGVSFTGNSLNSPGITNDGRTITWDLGTLTDDTAGDVNGAGDSDGSITVRYEVVVTNVTGNQAGDALVNAVTFSYDDDPSTSPNPRDSISASVNDLVVIEPVLSITKAVTLDTDGDSAYDDGNSGDAGDGIQYTITLTNSSNVDAFDIDFSDILPTVGGGSSAILGATLVSVTDTATSGAVSAANFTLSGTDASGYTLAKTATGIHMLASQVDASDDPRIITFTITGTVTSSVIPNQNIANTATVDWSSIDGSLTDQSSYTTDDTERTGADGEGSGNLNNHEASAAASFSINAPGFTKHLIGTDQTETSGSNVTIGEMITYALKVSMPEGESPDATVVDNLPAGLNYQSFELITDASDPRAAGLLTTSFAGTIAGGGPTASGGASAGDDVTFSFGAINVTVDNNDDNNAFLMLVKAQVADVSTNTGHTGSQTTLTNSATIDFDTDSTGPQTVDSTVSVVVVEPSLEIAKEFGSTVNTDLADSGDTVTVNLTVSNADGKSTAYEVGVSDTLNSAHYDLTSVNLGVSGTDYPADFTANFDETTGLLTYTGGDIAAGASVTFSFDVDLLKTVTPNSTLTNTATITDSSTLEGSVTGERNDADADDDGSDTDTDTVRIRRNSLAGFVWDDANNDGVKQAAESGIGGVEIRLTGTDHHGNAVSVDVTSSAGTGAYLFDNLRPGTYSIQQDPNSATATTIPDGFLDGKDSIGTPGGTKQNDLFTGVDLPTGTETFGTNNNFGEIKEASLSGAVYHDADNNGVQGAGETGLNGVDVQLTGVNDLGETVTLSRTTSDGGLYTFSGLRPSNGSGYTITQVNEPTGYFDGKDTDGSLANGDASTTNNVISSVDVKPGDEGTAYNFGEVKPSQLSGYVYHDSDNDGVRSDEPGTSGIPGSRITLTGTDDLGNVVNTFLDTDADGYFEFKDLRPSGSDGYTLTQTTVPAAYIDGIDSIGTPGGNGTVNNVFSGINVTSGTKGTENNFGELLPSSLSGFVFNDFDNDGNFETADGETGIAGVAVRIQGMDDLGNAVDITLNTNAGGAYTFNNLRPDNGSGYSITETQPAAYTDGQHVDGSLSNGNIATNNVISSIEISSGNAGTAYNFGEVGSSITGTVYVDDNQDGDLDAGEATRLGGVVIELFDLSDPLNPVSLGTTTTATDGTYRFSHLPAGNYKVVETQPAGYGNGTTNSLEVTLPLGGTTGNNFAEELYDIGDRLYFDANNNGVEDAGEQGLAGVDVTLQSAGLDGIFGTGDDPSSVKTTTNANGEYSFTKQFVGNYTVTVDTADLPVGMTGTDETDDAGFVVAINGTANILIDDTVGNRSDVDFGYTGSGTIGDFVFLDVDNDGNQGAGEPGLADVNVNLVFAGADGIFGNDDDLTLTTPTNSSGSYSFANLPAGDFQISVDTSDSDLPGSIAGVAGAQSVAGTANVTLTTGQTNDDIDFGFAGTRTLGDYLWLDLNQDQAQDADEPSLPYIDVNLIFSGQDGIFGSADDVTLSDTTDVDGEYLFENLADGSYRISYDTADLPANLTATFEVDGTKNNQADVTINAANRDDVDFGFAGDGTIGDFVFLDANADGIQDAAEPGLANITVNLTFAGADGIFGNTDDFTISTTTDSSGGYEFAGLPDGDFRIAVDATDSDLPGSITPIAGTDSISGTANVTLNAAYRTPDDIDFGFAGTRTVGNYVWMDVNSDGNQDADEPGLGNVGVTILFAGQDGIFGNADDISKETTTNSSGAYSFENLSDGDYRVSIDTATLPTGTTATHNIDGTLDNRGDFSINGASRNDIDFGYQGARSLGDRFWYDADADSIQDAAEPGIAGIDVTLTFAGKNNIFGDADDFTLVTTTSATGAYGFSGLPEGDYKVTYDSGDLPAGMTVGTSEQDDASAIVDGTANVGLGATDRNDVDFGFTGARTLGDFVFFDANNNGSIDASEPGFGDVEVTLLFAGQDGTFGTADDATLSTTTAADGSYEFTKLPHGDFRISLNTSHLPTGTSQTFEGDGTKGNQLDATISGSNIDTADFGFAGSSSIGNLVWLDANGDGIQDAGEPGLANVSVNLTSAGNDGIFGNADDFTLSTVTSAIGAYTFENLPAGSYRIAVDATDTDLPGSLSPVAGTESISGTANMTLAVGESNNSTDFGFTGNLSIGDRIWFDANGDAVQAATNEPGLFGVDVTLVYAGQDGTFGSADDVTKSTTTAANGAYNFAKLSDGDYRIVVDTADLPSGAIQSHDEDDSPFTTSLDHTGRIVLAGSDRTDVDFGYHSDLQVGDTFYHDVNADGSQAATDPGIAGVEVTATFAGSDNTFGTADDFSLTTTTNSTGDYLFDDLFAGDYRIHFDAATLPSGMNVPTAEIDDAAAAIDGTAHINVSANRTDVDFGFTGARTVGDRLWFDVDADGVQDAINEPGFVGVDVTIVFAGPNGVFGDLDDASLSTTTGADGAYSFSNLSDGGYRINFDPTDLPTGITQTHEQDGSTNNQAEFTVNGSDRADIDFGFNDNALISDQLWHDVDGDGTFNQYDTDSDGTPDTQEPGLTGITVTAISGGTDGLLSTTDDNFTLTTTTDANGTYAFANLPQGEYSISVDTSELPTGFVINHDKDDFGTVANDGVSTVALADDETDESVDFGFTGSRSVGDTIWFDRNGDGIQNDLNTLTGEPGLGGVAVTLTFAGADGDFTTTADNIVLSTTTDANGAYQFDDLFDGDYRVAIDTSSLPTGMTQTIEQNDGGSGTLAHTAEFNINAANRTDIDFGYMGSLKIGDTVWYDADGDGVQDAGEPGLHDVDVSLTFAGTNGIFGDADDFVLSTTTDTNGKYGFTNLPAGKYTVRATQPTGTTPTADKDGVAGASANQSSVTLAAGSTADDHDFGYKGTGSIADTVFFDIDDDATEEIGTDDRGLPGVDVTLAVDINGDGVTDYTTSVPTDANGKFVFRNLIPGTYSISTDPTDMPPGLAANPTVDDDGIATSHTADYTVTPGKTTGGSGFGYHATPDYDIVKTGNGNFTSAKPGDTVSYTIVVKNIGELDGRNVTITDKFPTGVLSITDPAGGTVDAANGTIEWDIAALAPDQKQVIIVTATVIDPIAAGTHSFTNNVTVDDDHYNGDDPDTTNNSSSYSATLDAAPDYSIAKSNGPAAGTLRPGDSTTYTITVTNDGNQDGTGVVVTDRFPVGVLNVTNAFGGTVDAVAGTITWNVGDLDAGDTVILQPEFTVALPANAAQTNVTNKAGVADDGSNGTDPTPDNNSTSDTDTLHAVPDYRITKTLNGDPASVTVNEVVTYSILVENIGDQDGTGVVVTDNYPTDILTNVVAPGATIDTANGTITWNVGDLSGDGDSVLLTVTAQVQSTLTAGIHDLINSAAVIDDLSNGTDPTPDNNKDKDIRFIDAVPDLTIAKSDDGATDVRPGETVVYTISFANTGVQDATNVVITETVPEGSSFFIDDSTSGWIDQGDGTYTFEISSLVAGEAGEIDFAVTTNKVIDPNREELLNVVSIADDGTNGPDSDLSNNTAEDTTPLQVYTFDSFQDFSGNGNDLSDYNDAVHGLGNDPDLNRVRPIPIDTVYTGVVDPGTTLSGKIYDEHGRMIGEQIVMADSAGNWLMQFPTVVLFEAPHEMRIDQTLSVQNSSFDAGFNLRRFFHPAVHSQLYMSEPISIGAAFYHSPSNVLEAMHEANNNPLGFGWMHHAYELVVSSTNTSAM